MDVRENCLTRTYGEESDDKYSCSGDNRDE